MRDKQEFLLLPPDALLVTPKAAGGRESSTGPPSQATHLASTLRTREEPVGRPSWVTTVKTALLCQGEGGGGGSQCLCAPKGRKTSYPPLPPAPDPDIPQGTEEQSHTVYFIQRRSSRPTCPGPGSRKESRAVASLQLPLAAQFAPKRETFHTHPIA